jgi:membrane associated rhomboid family serine protease
LIGCFQAGVAEKVRDRVFVPLHDDNHLKHIDVQYVTLSLIALNVMCFAAQAMGLSLAAVTSFALIPHELIEVRVFAGQALVTNDAVAVPEVVTLLTYMFLHGDMLHLAGNLLFLWVFGDNVEDACGHFGFAVLYLACGVLAGLTHVVMQPTSVAPLIGSSGAVAGVIAAYLVLHPKVRVWVLAFKFLPLRISAFWALGGWVVLQIAMLLLPQVGPVAWWAHIGGLIAGALLIVLLRRPGVALFDQNLVRQTTISA